MTIYRRFREKKFSENRRFFRKTVNFSEAGVSRPRDSFQRDFKNLESNPTIPPWNSCPVITSVSLWKIDFKISWCQRCHSENIKNEEIARELKFSTFFKKRSNWFFFYYFCLIKNLQQNHYIYRYIFKTYLLCTMHENSGKFLLI